MANFALDPGVGWHLATGEYILKHESIPRVDPFLASTTPRPWVSDQWLADVVLFIAYAVGSWPFVYGLLAALYLAAFYAILYPCTVRLTGAPILAATLTLIAFKLGQLHFILRPVVFGFLCFTILIVLVWRHDLPPPGRRVQRPLRGLFEAALFGLFVVWANLHPSWALGLCVLALRPLAAVLDRVTKRTSGPGNRTIGGGLRQFGCALAGTWVNPNGFELHRSVVALGSDPFFMRFHEEWLPPDPTTGIGLALLILCLLGAGSFITERSPRSFGSFELLICGLFAVLAFQSIRIAPFFGIAAVVPFTRSFANHTLIAPNSRGTLGALGNAWGSLSVAELSGARGLVTVFALCTALIVDPLARGSVLGFAGPFGPSTRRFPYEAVKFLADKATPQKPITLVAPPEWGGFITWFGRELVRPIIDDRNTLLGADFYRSFDAAFKPDGPLSAFLAVHGSSTVLVPHRAPLNEALRRTPQFQVVFEDRVGVVYEYSPYP